MVPVPNGKMPPVPDISDSLLAYLNYIYSNILPEGHLDLAALARQQGTREVIRHLEKLRQKQSVPLAT